MKSFAEVDAATTRVALCKLRRMAVAKIKRYTLCLRTPQPSEEPVFQTKVNAGQRRRRILSQLLSLADEISGDIVVKGQNH
jgi:hypothetical protein